MSRIHFVSRARDLGIVVVALVASGCDGKNAATTTDCAQGAERCACYPNLSCNEGLVCLSNVCVKYGVGSAGGNNQGSVTGIGTDVLAGIGQGGMLVDGAGGTPPVGNGGAIVTGGAPSVGNGGAIVTGGAPSVGNGGAIVTGGAPSVGSGTSVASGGTSTVIATLAPAGGSPATGGQTAGAGTSGISGPNLIKDGAFQSFDTYWNAILQEGDTGTYTRPPTAAAVCVTNTSTSSSLYYELSFTVGYPNLAADTFVIEPGATYTLSYTVSATYPLTFEVKIGHSVSPWTEVYSVTSDVLSTSYKTFSHQFTSVAGDTSAGLAFNAVLDLYGKMCFQMVSLTRS